MLSDPSPRSVDLVDLYTDEDDDVWLVDLARAPDRLDSFTEQRSATPKASSSDTTASTSNLPTLDVSVQMHSSTAPRDLSSHVLSRPVNEILEAASTTSYLPILVDDDLTWDMAVDDSGASLSTATSSSPTFFSIGEPSELSAVPSVPLQRSSDRDTLSSRSRSSSPDTTQVVMFSNLAEARVRSGPSLRKLACSISVPRLGVSGQRAIDGEEWERHCQGSPDSDGERGAHEGNEGSLVAPDIWHGTAIRSWQEGAACAKEGHGASREVQSELPMSMGPGGGRGMDEDGLEEDDMLWFE